MCTSPCVCRGRELNPRRHPLQGCALPLSYRGMISTISFYFQKLMRDIYPLSPDEFLSGPRPLRRGYRGIFLCVSKYKQEKIKYQERVPPEGIAYKFLLAVTLRTRRPVCRQADPPRGARFCSHNAAVFDSFTQANQFACSCLPRAYFVYLYNQSEGGTKCRPQSGSQKAEKSCLGVGYLN